MGINDKEWLHKENKLDRLEQTYYVIRLVQTEFHLSMCI